MFSCTQPLNLSKHQSENFLNHSERKSYTGTHNSPREVVQQQQLLLRWHLVFFSPKLVQQLLTESVKDSSQKSATKDGSGLMVRERVTQLGHVAEAQPPGEKVEGQTDTFLTGLKFYSQTMY